MGEEGGDCVEGLDCARRRAGEREDESRAGEPGDGAGKDRSRSLLAAFEAHQLGKTGDLLGQDGADGFGGDIAGSDAGAAGGEDGVDVEVGGEGADAGGDGRGVVGKDFGESDGPSEFAEAGGDGGAGDILAFAAVGGIADGEDGGVHFLGVSGRRKWPLLPPVFSRSWRDSMVMALSRALVMS